MRVIDILSGSHVWSRQNEFSWVMFIFSLTVNTTLKNNIKYIKLIFCIGYFERYVNWKIDYLELLLSVYCLDFFSKMLALTQDIFSSEN